MMNCPRAVGVPKQDREDLRLLWDLYYGDDDEEVVNKAAAIYGDGDSDQNFGIDREIYFDNSQE